MNDVLCLDVISGNWESPFVIGNAPCERLFHASVIHADQLFIHGGRKGPSSPLDDLHQLDLTQMKWIKIDASGDLPSPRWRHTLCSWGGKLIIFGGKKNVFGEDTSLNDFILFDPSCSKWKKLIPSSGSITERHSHTAQVHNDTLYIFGGMNSHHTRYNDLYSFNLDNLSLQKIDLSGCIPQACFSVSSVINQDKLILVGGISENSKNLVHSVNLNNFQSELIPHENNELAIFARHSCCMVGNRLYVIAGGLLCFSFGTFFNDTFALQFGENFEPPFPQTQTTSSIEKPIKQKVVEIPRVSDVSFEMFQQIYKERKPVIITGVDFGKCLESWKDPSYLKEMMGEQKVSVHVTKNTNLDFLNKNFQFQVMPASHFVDKLFDQENKEKYYFRSLGENVRKDVSDIFSSYPQISQDFVVPSIVPMAKERYFSSCLRFSSKQIRMWTHYDIMDNILCGIVGRKKITLWSPDQYPNLYVNESSSHVLDIENPDLEKYPNFANASPRYESILNPGEFLFLPACWFHNVITLDSCISINIFFKHLKDESYASKDLYGNKDLVVAEEQMQKIEEAFQNLQNTLPDYFNFYGHKIIDKIKSKYNL